MQEAYKNVDIQFLPDRIVNQPNLLENSLKQISFNLSPIEQPLSNLTVSNNMFSPQSSIHFFPQEFEIYFSFLSHLNM